MKLRKWITGAAASFALALGLIAAAPQTLTQGVITAQADSASVYTVKVDSGYLALRTAMAFDYANEIGKLYTGDTIELINATSDQYWYVYAPGLNRYGYVNCDYLIYKGGTTSNLMEVSVRTFLSLRGAATENSNEIVRMNNGELVQVLDFGSDGFYHVYVPGRDLYGYCFSKYLTGVRTQTYSDIDTMSVRVPSGYLALRTAMAYDSANEIGKLYTGDTVQVLSHTSNQYWYVYSPTLSKYGYVNADYLVDSIAYISNAQYYTVNVASGYLALRNDTAFDATNEIGKLYNGQQVQFIEATSSEYWYVYAPSLGMYGFINSKYVY